MSTSKECFKNAGPVWYGRIVARKLSTSGNPDDLVPYQFNLPLWMKVKAMAKAQQNGQDLATWLKALIVRAVGAREKKGGGK